ncbi:putative ATP-dependent Clp protease proteolytic subunit-like [Porphyridium purpureum]|uniref:ATP-dependent Clp protease proteolytic subunit n=1 Tax=Porphyridium purpureum TaxID=35688 RepID=A0A5J4YKY4_PORPP|nr:putative ATP-dependent Clp protease proteolytic subunit-like [Porphyridium purpureum]|eukprot:POR9583..scf210_14
MIGFVGTGVVGRGRAARRTSVSRAGHGVAVARRAAGGAGGVVRMMQSGASSYEGARIGPPPDLPSLLLHNRIVYIGMPLVPAVTELIIAELLYLQYNDASKPIFMYINSTGTTNPDGSPAGFETEAFAIADTMNYITPPVHTICLGQAFGAAAMLLANGDKGNRAALPNATVMLLQPRSQARGQAADIAIKAKEVLLNRKVTLQIIAECCGKDIEIVAADAARTKYLDPVAAKEYGLIDKVLQSTKDLPTPTPSFMSAMDGK